MGRQSGIIIVCFVTAHVSLVLFAVSLSTHYWIHATTHYHLNVTTPANLTVQPLESSENHTAHNHTPAHNHTKVTISNVTRTCSKGFWKMCCEEESQFWFNYTINNTIEVSEIIKLPVYVVYTNDTKNHSVNWTGCHEVHIMSKNSTGWFRASMFCCAFSVANLALANVLLYIFLLVPRFKRSFLLVLVKTVMYFVATAELVVSILLVNMHHHKDPNFVQGYDTMLAWSAFLAVAGACLGAVTAVSSLGITIVVKSASAPYETLTVHS